MGHFKYRDEKSLLLSGSRQESKRFTVQLLYIHLIINSLQ